MDIERLKEDIRNVEYDLEYGEEQHQGRIAVNVNCLRSAINFINKAIARQSVTDEAVREAIEFQEKYAKSCQESIEQLERGDVNYIESSMEDGKWTNKCINDDIIAREKREIFLHNLAITALQAYQPTTRKNRIVEEVAISKTETTSARALSCWYCTEIEKHGVVAVKTVLDKAGRKLDAYETPCNFCPNCGRKLTCPE